MHSDDYESKLKKVIVHHKLVNIRKVGTLSIVLSHICGVNLVGRYLLTSVQWRKIFQLLHILMSKKISLKF